ncbi:MAG TPA: hypothetical protein DEP60_04455, partial [Ruminococcaceae bacterium]|nr:hypothetical protein [Oscillospiraceae bacterium]
MKRLAQEARIRQGVVHYAEKHGKSAAARQYGVSLSIVKRWSKRYDGTWKSLQERSHRPNRHPRQHSPMEEAAIQQAFVKTYARYGWYGVYAELLKHHGYTRSFSGMYHAATRMGLGWGKKRKRPSTASNCLDRQRNRVYLQ